MKIGTMENKKININMIKFMCNKTTSFSFNNNFIFYPNGNRIHKHIIENKIDLNLYRTWLSEKYPLLLSKAVDGINETDYWKIDIFYEDDDGWAWTYKDYQTDGEYHKEADGAREAAIKHVMECENKNNGK